MVIDLNNPAEFTIEKFRDLLRSKDDSAARQLRCSDTGQLTLSDNVGSDNLTNVKFRFETWDAGNDYCGPNAASDDDYVERTYRYVKCAWEKNFSGYIDFNPCLD